MRMSIRNFPLSIDPSVSQVEAQLLVDDAGVDEITDRTPGTWRVLHRVPTELVHAVEGSLTACRHFFGDREALALCRFLVGYNTGGALTHLILIGDDGQFTVEDLPAELLGLATEKPSVRLVFDDPTDRERFIDELEPRTLDALAEPPRRIGVSVVPHDGTEG